MAIQRLRSAIQEFMASQSAGGVVLAIAALMALVVSNSPWQSAYFELLALEGGLNLGSWFHLTEPVLIWVNDLWMALFFFLVGLEIKRELVEGELNSRAQILLPAVAAMAGMAVPALLYAAVNRHDAAALRGWAIPAATDIAFALGVLTLLGNRLPNSLKVFLTAVAIIDDLGAILVIAFFYTADLNLMMLGLAGCAVVALLVMNLAGVSRVTPYMVLGLVLWYLVLKSGVHATIAGVLTALAVPLRDGQGGSPLRDTEHALHPWVAFVVLPVFAFANAGLSLQGVTLETLLHTIPLGIVLGLVLGKTVGVFGATWLLARLGLARLPSQASWGQMFGVCVLCGIGFTMSLFIGSLAFAGLGAQFETELKIGVLCASVLAGLLGALWLLRYPRQAA